MATASCLASGHAILGITQAHGRERVIVTIGGDGVTQYDLNTKTSLRSWALGKGNVEFSAPAVYHRGSKHYFAAVHGTSSDPTLLAWGTSSENTGTIQQIANHIPLASRVAAVLPVNTPRLTHPRAGDGASTMEIDTPLATAPAVYVVHTDGTVSLCSTAEVLSTNKEASGSPLVAASLQDGALHTVHSIRGPGSPPGALLGRFTSIGPKLRCDALQQVAPPTEGAVPVAAVHAMSRTVVLWSDSSVIAYDDQSKTGEAAYTRKLKGFTNLDSNRSSSIRVNAAKEASKTPGGKKKRGLPTTTSISNGGYADGGTGVGAPAALIDAGDGVVVNIGWSSTTGTTSSLRCIAIDAIFGAIQCVTTLSGGDILGTSTAKLDSTNSIQAVGLPSLGTHRRHIAAAVGGAAIVAELEICPPTLANLIGAFSVPFQSQHNAAAGGKTIANGGASSSPAARAALAASSALHEDDLAELVAPRGGTAGPLKYHIHDLHSKSNASSTAKDLLNPAKIDWEVQGAAGLRDAEAAAWMKLLDAGSEKKGLTESTFMNIAQPLLTKAQKSRAALSYDLLCKLLLVAAESKHWGAVENVLSAQHPGSLAGCPGLAAAMAEAHQYPLLHLLLHNATDVAASDIMAVLSSVLTSGFKTTAKGTTAKGKAATAEKKARESYADSIRKIVEGSVAAAEKAVSSNASHAGTLIATAACAAGTVESFSSSQLCLHPLLSVCHDGAVLLTALRDLPSPCAVALLKYLLKWVKNYRAIINDYHVMAPDLPELAVPEPEAVLQWTAAALDGGMSRFMLRKDAAGVVSELRREVAPQVDALRRLAQVKGAVEHLQCGAPLPAPPSGAAAGRYSMEWLSLKVA